jgi:geranylgeranylglycerol-phosphate geranylgeranyltransferase
MMKLVEFIRVSRPDVMLIGFCGYLAGVRIVRGIGVRELGVATAIALLSTNFIYTVNAIADRHIDAINSPERSIPAGRMSVRTACLYAILLGVGSLIYPLCLLHQSPLAARLLLLLPVWGIAYSFKPFRFKRYPHVAAFITSIGLVTPPVAGILLGGGGADSVGAILVLFGLSVCIVPLKDITDVPGDRLQGIRNLYDRYGRNLAVVSLIGTLLMVASALAFPMSLPARIVALALSVSTLCAQCCCLRSPANVYHSVIVACAATLIIVLTVLSAVG